MQIRSSSPKRSASKARLPEINIDVGNLHDNSSQIKNRSCGCQKACETAPGTALIDRFKKYATASDPVCVLRLLLCVTILMTTLVITAAAFQIIFNLWIEPSFDCSTESDLPQGNVRSSFVFTRGDDIFIAKVQVESCGGDNLTIQVNKLQWSPASVNFDSPLTLNFSATVSDVISAPVQVSVKVERHVWLMWVPVPCVDGVGSCTYDDVCSYTPSPSCAVLPHNLHLPCSCPVMPDKYFVDDGEVELPGSDVIPEWATHGWYRATVTVRSPEQDKQLACYKAKIHIG